MNGLKCDRCGNDVVPSKSTPPDGWQLEDGSTVCGPCCTKFLQAFAANLQASRPASCADEERLEVEQLLKGRTPDV